MKHYDSIEAQPNVSEDQASSGQAQAIQRWRDPESGEWMGIRANGSPFSNGQLVTLEKRSPRIGHPAFDESRQASRLRLVKGVQAS